MNSLIKLCCLLLTITATKGLEFSLDLDTLGQPGPLCGVLYCVEGMVTEASTAAESSIPSLAAITSLAIFRTTRTTTHVGNNARTGPGTGDLVASLTLQQPHVTRDSDGVKVEGNLDVGSANLRLELSRLADCRAEYTCQLHGRDDQGREVERTSRLLKQPEVDASLPVAAVTLQILTYVQQLDTKLAVMGKSVEGLEVAAADQQARTDDKTDSLEHRLEDRVSALEKTLQGEMQSFKSKLDDKIENQIVGKLWQLDAKVSALGSSLVAPQNSVNGDLVDAINALKGDLGSSQRGILENVLELSERVDASLNHSADVLEPMKEGMAHLETSEQKEQLLLLNLTAAVSDMSSSNGVMVRLGNELILSQAVLQETVHDLQWNISSSVSETLSSVVDSLYNTSHQGPNPRLPDPEPHVPDPEPRLSGLNACRKGMAPVVAQPPYPYPVVAPGGQGGLEIPVLCDTVTDGGGWIIIQRRTNGEVNFFRGWESYQEGFGELTTDFWLGNERLHALTSSGEYELRVELVYKGKPYFAHYSTVLVSSKHDQYSLHVDGYSGTAGDSLEYHDGSKFTTYDIDNDLSSDNCAISRRGGWWYNRCDNSNLNGLWGPIMPGGLEWDTLGGTDDPMSFSEMKIRRKG